MASPLQKFTVGRDKTCDIAIADDSVSRLHAEIVLLVGGKLSLTDRESSNGTVLIRQGKLQRIEQETLLSTDRVRFGTVEFSVKDLIEAIRQKYPAAVPEDLGKAEPISSVSAGPGHRPDRLIRCSCGAIKAANERCSACGE